MAATGTAGTVEVTVHGRVAEAPRETGLLLEQLAYAALHRTDDS
ncbi:hypothetical protein [Streptomyces violens]|nr:hypothetical protein [Streptomyces violens]